MMMMMCAPLCVLSFLFFFLTRLKNQAFFPRTKKKKCENPKQKGSLFPEGCNARRERERDRETETERNTEELIAAWVT